MSFARSLITTVVFALSGPFATLGVAGTSSPPQEVELIGLPAPGLRYAESLATSEDPICVSFYHDQDQRRWSHFELDRGRYYLFAGEAIREREYAGGEVGILGYTTASGMRLFRLGGGQLSERAEELASDPFPFIHARLVQESELGPSLEAIDVKPKSNCRKNRNPKTPPCDGKPDNCICIYIVIPN